MKSFFKFILIPEYDQSNTPFKAILRQSWFQMDPIQKESRLIGLLFIRFQQGPIFGPAKSGFDLEPFRLQMGLASGKHLDWFISRYYQASEIYNS